MHGLYPQCQGWDQGNQAGRKALQFRGTMAVLRMLDLRREGLGQGLPRDGTPGTHNGHTEQFSNH